MTIYLAGGINANLSPYLTRAYDRYVAEHGTEMSSAFQGQPVVRGQQLKRVFKYQRFAEVKL